MNLGLPIKLALAMAYVSFAAAGLGSAAYLLFERSSRGKEVDALIGKLATTRARVDLLYLVVGVCASIAAIALVVASTRPPGTTPGGTLFASVLLAVYYVPVTAATALQTLGAKQKSMRTVAWLSVAGLVPVVAALAIQYLL